MKLIQLYVERYALTISRFESIYIFGLFFLVLGHSLWSMSVGWYNPILEQHDFRQTQTAISAYYMLHGGARVAYETPVLGAPWAIPMEFPLYQWIVAAVCEVTGIALDQVGRLVSVIFFYLTLFPAFALLGALNVKPRDRLLFLTLLLASPLYLFWSRTFMIESTGLFFGMSYLACLASYIETNRKLFLGLGILAGVTCALVKVTTFVGFGAAGAMFVIHAWLRSSGARFSPLTIRKYTIYAIGFAVVPIFFALIWTHYADSLKELNPLAKNFITSSRLSGWNFGSLEQRMSSELWVSTLYRRMFSDIVGTDMAYIGLLLFLVVTLFRKVPNAKLVWLALAAFLSSILVFTNLHIVHNYYQYANGVFLVGAVGFAIHGQLRVGPFNRAIALGLLATMTWFGVTKYRDYFVPGQKTDISQLPLLSVARAVRALTDPDDVLLIYGHDWNSAIPYYSQRRAIMDFAGFTFVSDKNFQAAISNVKERLKAMLVCGESRNKQQEIMERLDVFGFAHLASYENEQCDIYLTRDVSRFLAERINIDEWLLKGAWTTTITSSDSKALARPHGSSAAIGSRVDNDSDIGVAESPIISLERFVMLTIPIYCGPGIGNIAVQLIDGATGATVKSFPISACRPGWTDWVISSEDMAALKSVKVVARDSGINWGQWLAIGEPTIYSYAAE